MSNTETQEVRTEAVAPPKIDKLTLKRMQQREARRKRLIGQGVPEDKVEMTMAQEDFNALPADKKMALMLNNAMNHVAQDIQALQHNFFALADAMDVNFKSMARCLTLAGVDLQKQHEIIQTVEGEIRAERQAKIEAQKKAAEQAAEEASQKAADATLKAAEGRTPEPVPEAPVTLPEGATEFGG